MNQQLKLAGLSLLLTTSLYSQNANASYQFIEADKHAFERYSKKSDYVGKKHVLVISNEIEVYVKSVEFKDCKATVSYINNEFKDSFSLGDILI
ncbi:MAG: hypothetical protein HRU03_03745 [Nanoarchaeales archaeon]|nr:hypothetical protein [Nanoarchaeales archaeon]